MKRNDFIKLRSLDQFNKGNTNLDEKEKIEYRKEYGKLLGKSRKDAKNRKCYYCDEYHEGFCNSHSIPAFIIKSISDDGEVYNTNKLIALPFVDEAIGIKKTGTFQLICRNCDSKIFSDYENPLNYDKEPTAKMIVEIAMKNYLRMISKRELEIPLYHNINVENSLPTNYYDSRQNANDLDLREYQNEFRKAKRAHKKKWDDQYHLLYYRKLNYVVPMAFQNSVNLIVDLNGNIVNDIYSLSPKYQLKDIHICVFPLENSTVLMMFVDSNVKRYRKFCKQFKKLSDEEQLKAINFIIFSLSEDVYISMNIDEKIMKDKNLIEVSSKTPDIVSSISIDNPLDYAKINFSFSQMNNIPNLLSEKHKLR